MRTKIIKNYITFNLIQETDSILKNIKCKKIRNYEIIIKVENRIEFIFFEKEEFSKFGYFKIDK
jgi:hypothetical protein